jgi:hypothetical protein
MISNNPIAGRSNHTMKKFSVFPLIAALAFFVSCQKQQTEEERKAEVERQVQDRLAAERLEADKQRIAQQQADLDAREKALANREAATPTPVAEEPFVTPSTEDVIPNEADGGSRSQPRSTAAYGMFYEKLDPYGEWLETKDYGYVWQPREAETSRDWRPYTEGHWVYSDAGWTWVSDEKFGWATYHYGRWVRLRRIGWVWVPGEEWAPAWVSWRTSKDYVGWAPLPPEARFDPRSGIQNWADSYYDIGPDQYSFVPSNEFGAEHVRRAVVPPERNINIVIETTNVTRITFANTTIVNEGPSYDELRSRSQRPIERYRLRRERNTEMNARISAGELEVSVPVLSEVRNIFRPRRVKERVTEVNVDNGWTSVSDRSAAERARTKIRAEATPPPNAPSKKFVPPAETAPTAAASATPAATVAMTPAPAANPTATSTAAQSATPTRSAPAHSATPVPAATAATSPTPSAVASSSPRTRPSPSIRPSATPAPAASATAATTPTPAISTTPRMRPSPSIPIRISPTPAATVAVPTATPPMIPRRTVPPRTTLPTPTVAPETSDTMRPLAPRDIRRAPPPRITPLPAASPTVAPETSASARPPMPRDVPRRTPPPRMSPPAATTPATVATPSIAATSPAATEERAKNRRPPRPAPGGTPTPTPAAPPP